MLTASPLSLTVARQMVLMEDAFEHMQCLRNTEGLGDELYPIFSTVCNKALDPGVPMTVP